MPPVADVPGSKSGTGQTQDRHRVRSRHRPTTASNKKRRSAMRAIWFKQLYVQVIIGIVAGGLLGVFWPDFAVLLQPFADGFIKLIKMLLAPIIFATVVLGLAKMGNVKEVGRIGVRAILYFEVVSTLALIIGLVVVNLVRPGEGRPFW
jgi:Na+/H+-dicarboxylate symporter